MQSEWRESAEEMALTVVIPNSKDVSKKAVERAVREAIEGENDIDQTNDGRKYGRGYKC